MVQVSAVRLTGRDAMAPHRSRIRVMIVNDHPIMRVGLRLAVQREPDLQLVCEVADAAEAVLEFERCHPDVVLIDLQLPHGSGLRAIEAIHALSPTAPVVVLTTFPGEADAKPLGPIRYVSKAAPSEEIMAAVREAELPFGPH